MRKNLLRLRQAPFNYWLGRSGWVVIAGFGSIVILLLILNIATTEAKEGLLKGIYILLYEKNTAGAWTVVLAIVSSPIAFVLWYFRDKNQQLQIENHRKDINLKDFQKLCEWASGLHLVEDKVTVNQKTNAQGIEKTETNEQSRPPIDSSSLTTSRRYGSIGLQIAAVCQLQAYIEGVHGKYFIKPALSIIFSLWEGLMSKSQYNYLELIALQERLKKESEINNEKRLEINQMFLEKAKVMKENIRDISNTTFSQFLIKMLFVNSGRSLAMQEDIFVNKLLTGFSPYSQGAIELDWKDFDLSDSKILYFDFVKTKLTKCKFSNTIFTQCEFSDSDVKFCIFESSVFDRCNISNSNIIFTKCIFSNLNIIYSLFKGTEFHNCTFKNIRMYGESEYWNSVEYILYTLVHGKPVARYYKSTFEGYIVGMNFEDCHFEKVDFNCDISSVRFNERTRFVDCKSDKTNIKIPSPLAFPFNKKEVFTHALRLRLRNTNGLILNPQAYTEYADKWNELSEVQQNDYYRNAYENANRDNVI